MNPFTVSISASRKGRRIAEIDIDSKGIVQVDVDLGIPLANASADLINCDLDLQTLPQATAITLLRDCRRILRPNGRVNITLTDIRALINAYLTRRDPVLEFPYEQRQRSLNPSRALLKQIGTPESNCSLDIVELVRIAGLVGLDVESTKSEDGHIVADLTKQVRPAAKAIEPLVSILIAAYRADYLDEAISSARSQTWTNIEIIVGDDSPNDDAKGVTERHIAEDSRIRYIHHEDHVGGRGNYVHLFEASSGELIKYLNDDDLLDPNCVQRMAQCLLTNTDVTLVTSHRRLINETGEVLPDIDPTRRPVRYDTIIDGSSAIGVMIQTRTNWIGEPTTAMFRRADIRTDEPDLLSFAGLQAPANADTTLWAHLLSQGDLIYLIDSLSSFRQHDGQRQRQPEFLERALDAWDLLAADTASVGMGHRDRVQLLGRPLLTRPWWSASVIEAIERADNHVDANELEESITALNAAINAEPEDAVIRLYRAQLQLAMGDLGGALLDLTTATTISPHYAPAQEQLAAFHHAQGNSNGVSEALIQMQIHHPSS